MFEIQGVPAWRWLRLKWRIRLMVMERHWNSLLVRLKLRKGTPRADPRSRIVGALRWLYQDIPTNKRDIN
jgi:hypothetical protein